MGPNTHTTEWTLADDDFDTAMGPVTTHEIENGAGDVQLDDAGRPAEMAMGKAFEETHGAKMESTRQAKPNKVYVGGLPDHTRPEDLQNCFGKIGNIVTIELKLGYGFVEFDSREAAEESVARYNEGFFMGNKIRVEPSHSRGRTFKRPDDPGACFKCGESGHWARECPRSTTTQSHGGSTYESAPHERSYSARNRDYHHQSSKDTHSYRDEHSRHPNSREGRFYDAASSARDHRRAVSPPRDRRDNPPRREYDDYHVRRSPPSLPAPRHDRTSYHGPERDYSGGAPPHRESYDRYDRRPQPEDRSVPYQAQGGRPRTPPGPPPPGRDDHDKVSRGHYQAQDTRRRAATPPPPYPGSNTNGYRSRRRSVSPPPRYDSRYGGPSHSDGDRYSGAPREGVRVRDYQRSSRAGAEDTGYNHRRS